jgi:F-type H+-transporting ATPase subunit epsilon
MAGLFLEILTPSKLAYTGNVKSVSVPGTLGSFQILFNHAPIISTLDVGTIIVEVEDKSFKYFATSGGTIEVLNNKIRILTDALEAVEDIDLERAKNALDRAQNRLANKDSEKVNISRAEAALARASNRIKIVEKYSVMQ